MPRTTAKSKSVSPAVTSEIRDVPPEAIADVRNEVENLKRPGKSSVQVAKFSKVSFEQFCEDLEACGLTGYTTSQARTLYDAIKLPTRATSGSAGYDICTPVPIDLGNIMVQPDGVLFPTGIRCEMNPAYTLLIIPKSGLGFKHYTRLANTIACIDSDFVYSDNEGDIMVKLRSDIPGHAPVHIEAGKAVCQALLIPYGVTDDDSADGVRNGGFGSTGR